MLKKFSIVLVLLAGIFWGSSPLFVSTLGELGFTSLQITAIRLILAAPILHICLLIIDRKGYLLPLKAYALLFLLGIGSILTMCLTYFYAMTVTSAAVSSVLLYTSPIFVMVMSVFIFKERFTKKKALCLTLAVLGCALTSGIIGGIQGTAFGVFVGLLSGFTYSIYGIISTFILRMGASPIACTTHGFTFAALGALFITNPIELVSDISACGFNLLTVWFLPLFSLCTAVIPFLLYTFGLAGTKPDAAAIAASSEPVVCTVVGVLLLDQPITVFQIIGIILVIAAIIILNFNFKRNKVK